MPILNGEMPVVMALQDAFAYFRGNLSTLIPEVFAYVSSSDQSEINSWFGDSANQILIQSGYPEEPIQTPQVAVTLDESRELDQFAGSEMSGMTLSIGSDVAYGYSGYFQTTFMCRCIDKNIRFLGWLQMLTKWALLYERHALMQTVVNGKPTGYFQRQVITCTPLRPTPNNLGDSVFTFERSVILVATHMDTWTGSLYAPMTSGNVTLNAEQ